MDKKILITGGAGFIGSHIAKRCLLLGNDVTIVDNLATGDKANVPKGALFIRGDISREPFYSKIAGMNFDIVLHLAAQSSGEISSEMPELDLKVNTLGTLLLLKYCRKNNISRFCYASSMAVYGNPSVVPVREDDVAAPLSFYGISKYSGEQYVHYYSRKGLDTTCFRMFSVYGPGQNMLNMKQGMVSIFLAYLVKGEEIWVKGSGDRFRDFIYIDDVVDVWCAALENKKTFGKTYNLATGRKTLVRELVEREIGLFGADPDSYPVRYEGTTPADQFGLYANIDLLTKDLGWTPRISLEEGLKKMISWVNKEYRVK